MHACIGLTSNLTMQGIFLLTSLVPGLGGLNSGFWHCTITNFSIIQLPELHMQITESSNKPMTWWTLCAVIGTRSFFSRHCSWLYSADLTHHILGACLLCVPYGCFEHTSASHFWAQSTTNNLYAGIYFWTVRSLDYFSMRSSDPW